MIKWSLVRLRVAGFDAECRRPVLWTRRAKQNRLATPKLRLEQKWLRRLRCRARFPTTGKAVWDSDVGGSWLRELQAQALPPVTLKTRVQFPAAVFHLCGHTSCQLHSAVGCAVAELSRPSPQHCGRGRFLAISCSHSLAKPRVGGCRPLLPCQRRCENTWWWSHAGSKRGPLLAARSRQFSCQTSR